MSTHITLRFYSLPRILFLKPVGNEAIQMLDQRLCQSPSALDSGARCPRAWTSASRHLTTLTTLLEVSPLA
jgi:hypothetical protein